MIYPKVAKATFVNLKNCLFNSFFQNKLLKRNQLLKNIYRGERCFILGSGQSVELYDLTKLEREFVITQNNFHKHKDIKSIKPNIHCIVPYYQTERESKVWIEWFSEMQSLMPDDAMYVLGSNTQHIAEQVFDHPGKLFYILAKYQVLTINSAKMDITKIIMQIPTALTMCLIIALYQGFSEIILLGFDFDQIISDSKRNFNRFYGLSKITDTSHERNTELNLIGAAYENTWYHRWLTIKQLSFIKQYADEHEMKIVNGSEEGILEVFGRKPVGKDFSNISLK